MNITFRLSSKTNENGNSEILAEVRDHATRARAKTEIYIRSRSSKEFPDVYWTGCYIDEALLKSKRLATPDVKEHRKRLKQLDALKAHITSQLETLADGDFCKEWLQDVINKYNHPEKYAPKPKKLGFYALAEQYLQSKSFSTDHIKGFWVVVRMVSRYEGYVREVDKRKEYVFDVDTVSREEIEDFRDYIRNEKALSEEHPTIYAKLLKNYPANVKAGNNVIEDRGENSVIKKLKKLKAFFGWLNDTGQTTNKPFEGIVIGAEKAGIPNYISIEERNILASTPMPTAHLEKVRDIFIFQCFIGCRVGDLIKLTPKNVADNVLTYTPHKTKNEGEVAVTARIPLTPTAQALIRKYKGIDSKGRLFPFISTQKYNDAIKEIFTAAGITRLVEVRDSLTGEYRQQPINEIASSHMARKTFVGNLYFRVQDPNLIGAMSGHVEGSKAFSRYRRIETETLEQTVNLLEG